MIFTTQEARDILRIDDIDNDAIIIPLVSAIPPYLEATTGYAPRQRQLFTAGTNGGAIPVAAMVLR